MAPQTGDLALARACIDRVLASLRGELPRLPDARAVTELEDALSVLDRAEYRVEGRPLRRGTLSEAESELAAATEALHAGRPADPDVVSDAGGHVETALQYLRWRVATPASPVLERLVAVASAAAGSARPLAEAVMRLGDELPAGPADEPGEARRAVELAFVAALRWVPLVGAAAGDPEAGAPLRDLEHSQASYLAHFLRERATTFPPPWQGVVDDSAAALEAAQTLRRDARIDGSLAVADQAARALRALVELRSPEGGSGAAGVPRDRCPLAPQPSASRSELAAGRSHPHPLGTCLTAVNASG